MNTKTIFLAVGFCSFIVSSAMAQRVISQLPDDGVAAVYEFSLVTKFEDTTDRRSGELTIQSVGESKVDGKPGRWIEMKLEYLKGPNGAIENFRVFNKALIREVDLKTAKQSQSLLIRFGSKVHSTQNYKARKMMSIQNSSICFYQALRT